MAQRWTINEEFLQQVERLQSLVKNNVAGQFGGNHQSKSFGSSCEFADYRDYVAGDDVTKIDWNAYARFDKLYLKLYLDERQMHTRIYIDGSRSMEYDGNKKATQAVRIAATLAYLSVCEMDKVSIYLVRGKQVEEVIGGMVGKEAYLSSIGKLNDLVFDGDSHISEAILQSKVGYGDGYSVVISDFLTENNFEDAIDLFASKKRDILCVQVLTEDELDPLVREKVHFFDAEDEKKFYRKNITRDVARAYQEALDYTVNRIKEYCQARGGSYALVKAEEPINKVFFEKFVNMGVVK